MRQQVNLVFSGGIAMAEHMAKAIICGADGIGVDYVLHLALECRLCMRCRDGLACPVDLDQEIDENMGDPAHCQSGGRVAQPAAGGHGRHGHPRGETTCAAR